MAAYAALVSVIHIIDNLRLHPRPPISLHKVQVESLIAQVNLLLEFLEGYNSHLGYYTEADPLESRIADAAYASEDVIESHIVDQISNHGENISSDSLYEALEKVIQDMASIGKEAMQMQGRGRVQNQVHTKSTPPDSFTLSSSSSTQEKSMVVGVDDVLLEMKHNVITD